MGFPEDASEDILARVLGSESRSDVLMDFCRCWDPPG